MTNPSAIHGRYHKTRVKFILDTNIVNFLLRNNECVKAHFQLHEPYEIALSSITKAK